eukprot:TRINITY_DN32460_c0_g1_i1.p2 TRINITY_DN32460_c0_g1~~TRINITY_DN32460_c0_g1_i1.p2  ORF type:complete len:178 (-),score=28.33 TRINITY_DN32460_c0_g1_i1:120-653(-)
MMGERGGSYSQFTPPASGRAMSSSGRQQLSGTGVSKSSTAAYGTFLLGGVRTGTALDPPFSRFLVDPSTRKVVDGGRYGNWAIGHGQGNGHWDRATPRSDVERDGRLASSRSHASVSGAHLELRNTNSQTMAKFLPGGLPFETSFERVMARSEKPMLNTDVAARARLITTQAGVVSR